MFAVSVSIDNHACTSDAKKLAESNLAKHVNLEYQFVSHLVRKGDVKIHYLWSKDISVDISTNELSAKMYKHGLCILLIKNKTI